MDLNYSLLLGRGESRVPSDIAKQEWLVDGKCAGMTTREMSWRKFGNFSQGTSHTFDCLFGACLWHFFHKFFIGGFWTLKSYMFLFFFTMTKLFFCIGKLLLSKFAFKLFRQAMHSQWRDTIINIFYRQDLSIPMIRCMAIYLVQIYQLQ